MSGGQKQEVILDCGVINGAPVYCVWFGPVAYPMPEFVVGNPVVKVEFEAAMKRFDHGFTLYIIRTVRMAENAANDLNPPDRYSEMCVVPRGRLFRVWLRQTSLVVRSDTPYNVAPIVVRWLMVNGRQDHIQKVTELPLYFEDENGQECGDLDYRNAVPLPFGAKVQGEPSTAGEFKLCQYASLFDNRR